MTCCDTFQKLLGIKSKLPTRRPRIIPKYSPKLFPGSWRQEESCFDQQWLYSLGYISKLTPWCSYTQEQGGQEAE